MICLSPFLQPRKDSLLPWGLGHCYRSAKGVGLRIVHWEGEEEEVTIQLRPFPVGGVDL